MPPRPQHAPLTQFPVLDNCLHIGGLPVTQLVDRVGQTPFYAYDRALLTQRVDMLRRLLPTEVHIHYAVKANPMPALVAHMAGVVEGMDVASLGELRTALDAGVSPDAISFAGPGKTDRELKAAVASGIIVNLESETETERLARLAERSGIRPKVAVRVNPDFELKASGMKMAGGPKPFGVDAERVPTMLQRLGRLDLNFRGFQIFPGSQNLRAESLIEAQDQTFELAFRLAAKAPSPVALLNIGGGFGIPYFPGDQHLDLDPIAEHLARRLPEVRERLPEAVIVLELGRYLVGEAGIYVCRIIDRKVSRGRVFLVTDGGLHHHLAASGNFGQVLRKNYPIVIANRINSDDREEVTVVGPLCTPLDILGDRVILPRAEPGDLIGVLQSGAYGFSASPLRFLGHPEPVEILL